MRIAMLVYDRFTATDIIGPYEVLSALPGAEVCFVAKQAGPVAVDTGAFALVAPYGIAEVEQADVLVVPGSSCGTFNAAGDGVITDWVRHIHRQSQWTTSVCTGALVLGAAGVLEGLQATTHWAAMSMLSQFGATPQPRQRVVAQGKVITCAGVSAGIDMALTLASHIAGQERAEVIQLSLEYDPQPPFNAGHVDKAPVAVHRLAQREMVRQGTTPRELWAITRLAGQRFTARLRRPLSFLMKGGPTPPS